MKENGIMSERRGIAQLDREPIFIVGAARSGTTWVYDILTAHPRVAGIFESWLFTQNNGLMSLFTDAHRPENRSGLGRFVEKEALIVYVRDLATRIMSHALKPEHRFLVEKSPSHLYSMSLIHEIFPGSRFIHVVRDGRDVSVSVKAAIRSWVPNWRKTFGRSIKTSARSWKHAIRRARREANTLGSRYLEIKYEHIHNDPLGSYRKLFDFCGIPYNDEILQMVFNATDFNKNFKPNESGFRRGGRIGDWRDHFSLIDALVFNFEAGEMLVELGYEKNRKWFPH